MSSADLLLIWQVTPLVPTWKEITITLISARALAPRDISGKSDPYVVITCGEDRKLFCGIALTCQETKYSARSAIQYTTLDPNWNEAFSMDYGDDRSKISFDLYDYDRIGKVYLFCILAQEAGRVSWTLFN